jgi:hypothetical protein
VAVTPWPCAGVRVSNRTSFLVSPAFRRLPPPLIIVGMHRSGTSLVSGMLSILGVYLDPSSPLRDESGRDILPNETLRRNGYGEAEAFRRLNERILLSAGSDWDKVEPFLAKRYETGFRRMNLLRMQWATFAGLKRGFLDLAPGGGISAWGWKDPRTSLTLPLWLQLFPDARVLHVRRDPEKVVDSLMRRHSPYFAASNMPPPGVRGRLSRALTDPAYRTNAMRRILGKHAAVTDGGKTGANESDWLALTQIYTGECERCKILGTHYLEVQYEDILREPYASAMRIAGFAETYPSLETLRSAADFVIRDPVRKARATESLPQGRSPKKARDSAARRSN